MLYIKSVELRNIRCFEKFTLEFKKKNESYLIVGDNGEGKSTLLRSIAISLCDISSAAALFRELRGNIVRQNCGDEPSYIEIYLQDTFDIKINYIIRTTFHSIKRRPERLSQELRCIKGKNKPKKIKQDEFPWNRIFVVGYGAGGRVLGTENIEPYAAVDGVYTLFRYDEPLQNPELALHRLKVEGDKAKIINTNKNNYDVLKIFLELLREILNLGSKDKIYLTRKGIEVRGPWGRSQLETLGDGYKSTVIWVLDFIGRRIMYSRLLNPKKMTGIVLLDEVEQHLHPKWQIKIMKLIREAFPKIQLIATTHSPLVVSGCENCKIRKTTSSSDEYRNAFGWLAENVYREILELPTSRAAKISNMIKEFEVLHLKKISDKLTPTESQKLEDITTNLETVQGAENELLLGKLNNLKKYLK